jgi:hypothetical protein
MRIHLVNPSDVAFGVSVITPRWLYVLAAATPERYGNPVIVDETLESIRLEQIQPGDVRLRGVCCIRWDSCKPLSRRGSRTRGRACCRKGRR